MHLFLLHCHWESPSATVPKVAANFERNTVATIVIALTATDAAPIASHAVLTLPLTVAVTL